MVVRLALVVVVLAVIEMQRSAKQQAAVVLQKPFCLYKVGNLTQ